jgi:hypothetical protein
MKALPIDNCRLPIGMAITVLVISEKLKSADRKANWQSAIGNPQFERKNS